MRDYYDDPITCVYCDRIIEPGDDYLEYDKEAFCDEECIKDYLFSRIEKHVIDKYIMSPEEVRFFYEDARAERIYQDAIERFLED